MTMEIPPRNSSSNHGSNETKLYVIINSETPIYMKVPIPPEHMTLAHVKSSLSLQYGSYKYYFKSNDHEFGEVKEEVVGDHCKLPYSDDKIVAYLISDVSSQGALFNLSTSSSSPKARLDTAHVDSSVQLSSSRQDYEPMYIIRKGLRGTYSLPRSITPRSLYNSNNHDTLGQISRSVYESSSPPLLRHLDTPSLHCGRDNIHTIYSALKSDSRSLDIRDREWLKVTVKDAFLGSSLVKWLSTNVYGFSHRKEVKRYANQLLTFGFIRDPMESGIFSERCYYTLS